jgi:hypothetical protein
VGASSPTAAPAATIDSTPITRHAVFSDTAANHNQNRDGSTRVAAANKPTMKGEKNRLAGCDANVIQKKRHEDRVVSVPFERQPVAA